MPIGLQYVWLGYQLYATMAMYMYRFTRAHQWATSEARLAQKLAAGNDEQRFTYLQDDKGTTVKGTLTRVPVANYGEGQKFMKEFLSVETKEHYEEKGNEDLKISNNSDTLESTPNDSDSSV